MRVLPVTTLMASWDVVHLKHTKNCTSSAPNAQVSTIKPLRQQTVEHVSVH